LNIYKDGIFTTYDKLQKALGLFKVEWTLFDGITVELSTLLMNVINHQIH
jgi:hypothetical protein